MHVPLAKVRGHPALLLGEGCARAYFTEYALAGHTSPNALFLVRF